MNKRHWKGVVGNKNLPKNNFKKIYKKLKSENQKWKSKIKKLKGYQKRVWKILARKILSIK